MATSNVKFWYSARDFDSCSKGEIKFKNGSVIRVNIPPRIKVSVPKLNETFKVTHTHLEKMFDIIDRGIYAYTPESTSKDQFEHGIQALFNVIGKAESVEQAVELVLQYKHV